MEGFGPLNSIPPPRDAPLVRPPVNVKKKGKKKKEKRGGTEKKGGKEKIIKPQEKIKEEKSKKKGFWGGKLGFKVGAA